MSGCRRTALWGLAILVATIGFVWWMWFPRYTYHQKITVTVEAGGKEYSASSVTAVTVQYSPKLLAEAVTQTAEFSGEAVHLKLPNGKLLFITLRIPPGKEGDRSQRPMGVVGLAPHVYHEFSSQRFWAASIKRLRDVRLIPENLWPLMVTFDDSAKPETVREVNPDFLAETFGEGVRLKSIALAIVDEPVGPNTIESALPWLPGYTDLDFRLSGAGCHACPVQSEILAEMMWPRDFWSGTK